MENPEEELNIRKITTDHATIPLNTVKYTFFLFQRTEKKMPDKL